MYFSKARKLPASYVASPQSSKTICTPGAGNNTSGGLLSLLACSPGLQEHVGHLLCSYPASSVKQLLLWCFCLAQGAHAPPFSCKRIGSQWASVGHNATYIATKSVSAAQGTANSSHSCNVLWTSCPDPSIPRS